MLFVLIPVLHSALSARVPDVKNYKWRLNPVWHRMLYTCSCTHMTTVGVKGLMLWCRWLLLQGDSVGRMPFVYVTGNWSECSVQCGHSGVQSRSVVCRLLGDGWALDVAQSYCDVTAAPPISERDCGYVDTCPRWKTAEWSQVRSFLRSFVTWPEPTFSNLLRKILGRFLISGQSLTISGKTITRHNLV